MGASACLHVATVESSVTFGSDLIGGLCLGTEIVDAPLVREDIRVEAPICAGLGQSLNRDKPAHQSAVRLTTGLDASTASSLKRNDAKRCCAPRGSGYTRFRF